MSLKNVFVLKLLPPPQAFPRLSGDWGTRARAREKRERGMMGTSFERERGVMGRKRRKRGTQISPSDRERLGTRQLKLPYQSPGGFRQVYWENYDHRKEVMRILPPPLALVFRKQAKARDW